MFKNVYYGKTVLVTGHTGFKGSWLTSWLLELGAKVVGVSKDIPTSPSMYEQVGLDTKIVSYIENIKNLDTVKGIINKHSPDFIFHLAAQPIVSFSYNNPLETYSTNVIGTANVLECLRGYKKDISVIMITSDKCYNNVEWVWGYKETDPLGGKDPYSASKGAAELVINSYYESFFKKMSHVRVSSVRAGNVIGGGDWAKDRIVPDCYKAWSKNHPVQIRSPKATRPWQHVLEPLSGYLVTGQFLHDSDKYSGESYNFGPTSESNYTVDDLLHKLAELWGKQPKDQIVEYQDNSPFNESRLLKLNCDKALFDLNWKPTLNYMKTIEFVGSWYNKYYLEEADLFTFTKEQIYRYVREAKEANHSWVN